jgi:hypothetical protein
MEYRGSLTDCQNKVPAKAQRRKEKQKSPIFAALRLCGILLLLLVFLIPATAQPRGVMRPADIVRVANVTDAQISPNGQFVVYTVSSVADDKTVSTLWIARLLPEILPVEPTAQPTPSPRPGSILTGPNSA